MAVTACGDTSNGFSDGGGTGGGSSAAGGGGMVGTGGGSFATGGGMGMGGGSTGTGGGMTRIETGDTRLDGITAAHNVERASAMPLPMPALPPMTWAADLAVSAQTYADKCIFEHDAMNPWGENLYANWPPGSTTPQKVVQDWASEKAQYNYAANSCSNVCGHYTQVVWRSSTEVGCGVKTCSNFVGNGAGEFWVCRYRQAGNFNNQRPY
ncbi:MAG: hypothetical protein K1X64_20690 [Myxococcaceae bacterium]|nr:hypothetical protein [Myxococcaceae bacterium]